MKVGSWVALLLCGAPLAAQLTPEQKLLDFQQLAALYAKEYGPYEWKLRQYGFDLLKIGPWLDRVRASKDDLEFYEINQAYVNSLRDAHSAYFLPSDFFAFLGFTVDVYDGRYLVDGIDANRVRRGTLPAELAIGDELLWLDGRSPGDWARLFSPYISEPNPLTQRRQTAQLVTLRVQEIIPRAHLLPESAVAYIRHRAGAVHAHVIPWDKGGRPLLQAGPVPSPKVAAQPRAALDAPSYMSVLEPLRNWRIPSGRAAINYGNPRPVFALPAGFTQRLGRVATDIFFSGTYTSAGLRIGFLRIRDFSPFNLALALNQFTAETTFFDANTDALVLDVMANPGGNACYLQELLRRVIPYRFQMLTFQFRPTRSIVIQLRAAIDQAKQLGAPAHDIEFLEGVFREVDGTYRENRGLTGLLSLCSLTPDTDPVTDRAGNVTAYSKPVVLLADELSASAGDAFAAVFQDARRGPVVGMRTMGAGGSVEGAFQAGFYSEQLATVTRSLLVRSSAATAPGFPVTNYIENVGVRPDIEVDYMTEANLLERGAPFVNLVNRVVAAHVVGGR